MSVRKSIFLSYFTRYGQILINVLSSVVLARLLLPEEIGIFSVSIALVGFAHLLRDFGAGEYLIQEKQLTDDKIRSAFSLHMFLGWGLAGCIFFAADMIAHFYNQPGMARVLRLLSVNFVLIPFGAISYSLLYRNMRFDWLMRSNFACSISEACVSIGCAWYGLSYMSLAWGSLANVAVSVIFGVALRPKNISFMPTLKEIRAVVGYGKFSSLTGFLRYLSGSAPELIMGKMLNMNIVGIFNRGQGLLGMISKFLLQGFKPVLLPYFAQIQREREDVKGGYFRVLDFSLVLAWPVTVVLLASASELVHFLYGEKWMESVQIVQILGLGFFVYLIISGADDLFKATGKVKQLARVEGFIAPLRILIVLVCANFGVTAIVTALAMVPMVRVFLTSRLLYQEFSIRLLDCSGIFFKNAIIAIICGLTAKGILILSASGPEALSLLLTAGGCIISWLGCVFFFRHRISKEIIMIMVSLWRMVHSVRK